MSRKQSLLSGQIKPEAQHVEEELHELDKAEVQDDILQPTSTEIVLVGGKLIYLPNEFSLDEIFNAKVHRTLFYFYSVYKSQLDYVRGSRVVDGSDSLITGILFKPTIISAMEEMVAEVTKLPLSTIIDRLDNVAVLKTFAWVIKMLSTPTGDSKAPKANVG